MRRRKATKRICYFFALFLIINLLFVQNHASHVNAAITAPSLISPSDGEYVGENPFLEWTAVTNATKYQVQVSSLIIIWDPFLFANTTTTNYTIFFVLPQPTNYWKVRATEDNVTWGPFSETWSFSIDETKPYINRPPNVEYNVGETGNEIDWIPIDDFPGDYVVYFNDSVLESGQWNSTDWITINVDGLDKGVYNYTIWIDDQSGQTNVDTVWVTVLPPVIPELNNTLYMLVPTLAVVGFTIFVRRKRA